MAQLRRRRQNDHVIVLSNWGESGPRPEPNHELDELFATLSHSTSVEVLCTPPEAWDLVSNVDRIGEFSPECAEAWWVEGYPAGAVGGRFEGRNRVTDGETTYEWIRPCDVTEWEPMSRFTWTVGDRFDGTPATRWSFVIELGVRGIALRQEFTHLPDGLSGLRLMAEADQLAAPEIVARRREDLRDGISLTLTRMKATLEAPTQ